MSKIPEFRIRGVRDGQLDYTWNERPVSAELLEAFAPDEIEALVAALDFHAFIYEQQGRFDWAEAAAREFEKVAKRLPPEKVEAAKSLGRSLESGMTPTQREHFQRILALRKQMLRLKRERRFAEAIALADQVLAASREGFGQEHLFTANALRDLGNMNYATGVYGEAAQRYRQALAIYRKELDNEDPSIAADLNNLGAALQKLDRFEEAVRLHQEALDLCKRAYDSEHADTASSLNNLGAAYLKMGELVKAKRMLEEALAIE